MKKDPVKLKLITKLTLFDFFPFNRIGINLSVWQKHSLLDLNEDRVVLDH